MKKEEEIDTLKNSKNGKEYLQRILIEDTLEYKVIFAATQLDFQPHSCGGYQCTLAGEFYKISLSSQDNEIAKEEEMSFDPPLIYSLANVLVATSDVQSILKEIYQYLQEEKNSNNQPHRRIGFI